MLFIGKSTINHHFEKKTCLFTREYTISHGQIINYFYISMAIFNSKKLPDPPPPPPDPDGLRVFAEQGVLQHQFVLPELLRGGTTRLRNAGKP